MSKKLKIFITLAAVILLPIVGFAIYVLTSVPDYYEYSAKNAGQCSKGEEWDEEYKICSFDYICFSDDECAIVDEKYTLILNNLASNFELDKPVTHGKVLAIDNNILSSDSDQTEKIRQMLRALLPNDYFLKVSNISVESDGQDGLLAYVYSVEGSDGKFWGVGYDPADAFTSEGKIKNPDQLLKTIVHEFGHILSLDETQVTYEPDPEAEISCKENETVLYDGCVKSGAYINGFATMFWPKELIAESDQAYEDGTSFDFADALYEAAPDSFVSQYAPTHLVEDFAESFTDFIMIGERHNKTIADQKVEYFYQYPELLSLRKRMRGGLYRILIQSKI